MINRKNIIIIVFIIIIIILIFSKKYVVSFIRHLGSIKNRILRYSKAKDNEPYCGENYSDDEMLCDENNNKPQSGEKNNDYSIYKELNMKEDKKGILSISLFGLSNPNNIDCSECTNFLNMNYKYDKKKGYKLYNSSKSLYSCFKNCTGNTDKFYKVYLNYYIPLKNSIQKLRDYFPEGWYYRIYLERDTDPKIIDELVNLNCEVIIMKTNSKGLRGTLWRFLPLEKGETFFSMEADHDISRNVFYTPHIPNYTEKFLKSEKPFIRFDQDITNILYPLSAPAWGAKNIKIENIRELMDKYDNTSYGDDEVFLAKEVFPYFQKYGYIRVYNIVEVVLFLIILIILILVIWKIIK